MGRMRDRLNAMRAAAGARAQLAKDEITLPGKAYNAAIKFQRDKALVKWYDSHLKGQPIHRSSEILANGVMNHEITQEQSDIVSRVIAFAGAYSDK